MAITYKYALCCVLVALCVGYCSAFILDSLDVKECKDSYCNHNGKCEERHGDKFCICSPEWVGDQCESACDRSYCNDRGECHHFLIITGCTCDAKAAGSRCEQVCSDDWCHGNGDCYYIHDHHGDSELACHCNSGYSGTQCDVDGNNQPPKTTPPATAPPTTTVIPTFVSCDQVSILSDLTHNRSVAITGAGLCSNGKNEASEALVMYTCPLQSPDTWTKGLQAIGHCDVIPRYTPIATFMSDAYPSAGLGRAGFMLGCTATNLTVGISVIAMDRSVKTKTLYQAYCDRCNLSGAIAAGQASNDTITGSDFETGDGVCEFERLDHSLTHIEIDHAEIGNNQRELSQIASTCSISVQTSEEYDHQSELLDALREEINACKEENKASLATNPSLILENDELKEKYEKLQIDLSNAEKRETELQRQHKDEIESLNKKLAELGEENERLKKMVENSKSKMEVMMKLQAGERKAAQKERHEQEQYRKKMDEKFRKQEEHNIRADNQNREILNLLRGLATAKNDDNATNTSAVRKKKAAPEKQWVQY